MTSALDSQRFDLRGDETDRMWQPLEAAIKMVAQAQCAQCKRKTYAYRSYGQIA